MTGLVLDRMETCTSMNKDSGPIIVSTRLAGSGLQSTVHFVYLSRRGDAVGKRKQQQVDERDDDTGTGCKRRIRCGGEAGMEGWKGRREGSGRSNFLSTAG